MIIDIVVIIGTVILIIRILILLIFKNIRRRRGGIFRRSLFGFKSLLGVLFQEEASEVALLFVDDDTYRLALIMSA